MSDATFGRNVSVRDNPITAGEVWMILPTYSRGMPSSYKKKSSFGRSDEVTPYCIREGCFSTASFIPFIDMPAENECSNISDESDQAQMT